MDNPGISLFEGADIQFNNSKNVEEEEEDLEDQLRRKEELQNLLAANLDEFKYDDSSVVSSTNVSLLASNDNFEKLYKDAITPQEQLKVLYDVKCREIENLRTEYQNFKLAKNDEIESQIKQKLLLEAELRQLKVSLKNAENLLIEKNGSVADLETLLNERNAQMDKFQNLIQTYENENAVYKSEIAELHIKFQAQNGPFNLNAKYNSEEFTKSLQEKIQKLEHALEEKSKSVEIYQEDQEEMRMQVFNLNSDKEQLIREHQIILSNFDKAQQQCRDLIDLMEIIRQENEHFKGRLNEIQSQEIESLLTNNENDQNSHTEKLRKLLVDKSVEIDTLNSKIKCYENILHEVIEYRQLKHDVWKKEFQKCDNQTHTKDLILMQNELQNYKTLLDDKNQQIKILNLNNKDLKEKIEEMILQTRNEIQNMSARYNMPQLELMSKELEKAETKSNLLSSKLEESEERRLSLLKKFENQEAKSVDEILNELQKTREDLKSVNVLLQNEQDRNNNLVTDSEYKKNEIFQLKNELQDVKIKLRKCRKEESNENVNIKNEYESLKDQLKTVVEHLEKNSPRKGNNKESDQLITEIKLQMEKFLLQVDTDIVEKGVIEDQINSWKKLLDQITVIDNQILKEQYKDAVINIHSSEERIKKLEEKLNDLNQTMSVAEHEIVDLNSKLEDSNRAKLNLINENKELALCIETKDEELIKIKSSAKEKQLKTSLEAQIERLNDELKILKEKFNFTQIELNKSLDTIKRFEEEKKENEINLEKLKNEIAQNNETERKMVNGSGKKLENNEQYAEELMNAELKLREKLQIEYQKRITDIEQRYQNTCKEATNLYKEKKTELEKQDKKFREYLKVITTECDTCIKKLENEKAEAIKQLKLAQTELQENKENFTAKFENHLKKLEIESAKNNADWKEYSKTVVSSALDIEATNKKVRDRILANMERFDEEVEIIRNHLDAKKLSLKTPKKL